MEEVLSRELHTLPRTSPIAQLRRDQPMFDSNVMRMVSPQMKRAFHDRAVELTRRQQRYSRRQRSKTRTQSTDKQPKS